MQALLGQSVSIAVSCPMGTPPPGGHLRFGVMTNRQGHPMLSAVPTPGLNGYSKLWSRGCVGKRQLFPEGKP